MDESTHDPQETDPTSTDADEQDPASEAASDPPGQAREFEPEAVENDPAHEPPVPGLKDLKGG